MKKLSFLWFDFVLVNKILIQLWGLFPYKKLKTGIKQPDFSSGLFNAYFYIKVKIYFWVNSSNRDIIRLTLIRKIHFSIPLNLKSIHDKIAFQSIWAIIARKISANLTFYRPAFNIKQ